MPTESSSPRRQRRSSEMYPLVEAYISGNMSREAFCQAHAIPVSALSYWQTKYRKEHGLTPPDKPSGFVPLEVGPGSGKAVVMELVMTGGSVLRFYSYPEAGYLQSLLAGC